MKTGCSEQVLSEQRAKNRSDLDGVSDCLGPKRAERLRLCAFLASGTQIVTRQVKGSDGMAEILRKNAKP